MRGRRRAARDPALLAAVVVLWALLALFIVYPLGRLVVRTFTDGGHLTLGNVLAILGDSNHRQAFWNSLLLGALVGICGTALGFLFALTAARANLSRGWVTLLDAATLLPLVSPPFTTAIAMIFSFGPRGLITYGLLGLKGVTVYGLASTLFSETLTYFPIAYLTLKPILAGIDPNVEDMAQSLGASRWRVFLTVTLPLAVPGFANAFLLLFTASLADFATPLILAGNSFPVLPTQAYLQITGLFDLGGGAVLSFVLLVPALAVYLLQRYWVSRRSYVAVTGKVGAQTTVKTVAPWLRLPLLGGCLAVAVAILYFYLCLAPSGAGGQAAEIHGEDSAFAASGGAIVWGVLRGSTEEETQVVLRIVSPGSRWSHVSMEGVDPFTRARRPVVEPVTLAGPVDVTMPRASFADFPRREIMLYRSAEDARAGRPGLTVYYLGVPDTTPEFASEAALSSYLTARLTRLSPVP